MSSKKYTPLYDVPDFPSYLGVAVSYACNYKCLGCIHGNKTEMLPFLQTRKKFMSVELFRAIIDEIAERHPPINLTSPGETLAHPEIYDMIAYASRAGVDVEFDTNGSLVSPEELAGCGARHVTFSIDGMTQDAYGAYRRGGDLQQVLGKLEDLVSAVQRRDANMNIYVKYLVNSYTEDTLDEAAKYFEGLPGVTLMIDFFRPPPAALQGIGKVLFRCPLRHGNSGGRANESNMTCSSRTVIVESPGIKPSGFPLTAVVTAPLRTCTSTRTGRPLPVACSP